MSIQQLGGGVGVDAAKHWREPMADVARTQANGQSGSSRSSIVSELSEEFSALAEMFKGMLSGIENDIETQMSSAKADGTANTAGSNVAQLLGSRSVAAEQNSPPVSGVVGSSDVSGSNAVRATSAVSMDSTPTGVSGGSGVSGTQSPADEGSDPDNGPANVTSCTLAQAQSVLGAFPGATLEVWPDGSLPVPASSYPASPDELLPYVINFGTNASTGKPDLYYASVIYNAGQQAMQPTDQGSMKAGEYYVWNTTPDADGVMTTIDAGSSFNQFAQYYMSQINAHKAVDLYSAEA